MIKSEFFPTVREITDGGYAITESSQTNWVTGSPGSKLQDLLPREKLNHELLPQKVLFSSWDLCLHFSLPQRDRGSGWGRRMPSLGEKGLFQEGSHSGTSDPSHKDDSFPSFQGFKATYMKGHGWREAPTLPSSSLGATRNTQRY